MIQTERLYPRHPLAAVVVWLLDRLPDDVRLQVLRSYYRPADVEAARREAERLAEYFRGERGEG